MDEWIYFCEWCGQICEYNGCDTNTDGVTHAEYWCGNCCEYEYVKVAWMLPTDTATGTATERE